MKKRHTPVLVDEVIEVLRPSKGESFLDMTAGYGGHATALLEKVGSTGRGYLVDQDAQAIAQLQKEFGKNKGITIIKANFADREVAKSVPPVDMILLDLGVSSAQLDDAERGFSFQTDSKLDMRMDQQQRLSAYEIVNHTPEGELAEIIYQYGEERRSRQVAAAIVQARRVSPIVSTAQLSKIVSHAVHRRGKIHPATKTFQAIRIAVNDELGRLEQILAELPQRINPGGRIAIISFHSLEDRRVKQAFRALSRDTLDEYGHVADRASFKLVTKKAILGSLEDRNNPRARSAKLRAVEQIKK